MKRCQICGQLCDDNVKFCTSCGNNNFTQESQQTEQAFQTGQSDYSWSTGIGELKGDTNHPLNASSVSQGIYSYEQNHMGEQGVINHGQPMTKSQFYKSCVPSHLKNKMAGGYAILILNFVVFLGLAVWYEEPLRLVDCVVLLVILLGLMLTKNLGFAIADAVYFTFSFLITLLMQQRAAGILAIIIAFSLIPVTYRIGKLWRNYQRTGEYVCYNMEAIEKKSAGRIATVLLSIAGIALVIVAMIYMQDGGFSSFESGTWDGLHYENESLNLSVDVPSGSWKISEEEELQELTEQAKIQAGYKKAEEFESMVTNLMSSSSFMILHIKGSISEQEAVTTIKDNLTASYQKKYGYPSIVNAGKKILAGEEYTRLDVRVSMYGMNLYQRIYVKKVGREICELVFSGKDQEQLDEMEEFVSPLK